MRIGLIGGTGKEAFGLAARWAKAGHSVVIGSRDAARAAERAREVSAAAGSPVTGTGNDAAARDTDVVWLCVPYSAHEVTLRELCDALQGKIVVDIAVPLQPPKVRQVHLPAGQSAALEAQQILGPSVRVAATMHHVSAAHLAALEHAPDTDVLVCADAEDVRKTVIALIADAGMRGVDAGVLQNSIALEALTPVLLHINKQYKAGGSGIRITGIGS